MKIYETRAGPSHVDEAAALAAVLFLASAAASYLSIRLAARGRLAVRLERAADACFIRVLAGLAAIALLFAYEAV